jgi:RHS repeat-associated protein
MKVLIMKKPKLPPQMLKNRFVSLLLALALLLSSCIPPFPNADPTDTATPNPSPSPAPKPEEQATQNRPVIKLAGSANANVDASGTYHESVAIQVPSYHGLEPNLNLFYKSSSGNGILGVGWNLSGDFSIIRVSAGKGSPNYDASDVYLLNGMELIRCQSSTASQVGTDSPSCKYPASSAYISYTTRIESFQRIAYDQGTNYWYVWSKTGIKTTYQPRPFRREYGPNIWDVAKIEDTVGNYVTYVRWSDVAVSGWGETYLRYIIYNGALIVFFYDTRPDPYTYSIGYELVHVRYRINVIDVRAAGQRVRSYAISYGRSSDTGRSILTAIQQYGSDADICTDRSNTRCRYGSVTGSKLPAYQFTTSSLAANIPAWTIPAWTAETQNLATSANASIPLPANSYNATTYNANSNWFYDPKYGIFDYEPNGSTNPWFEGDLNGDGRIDLIGLFLPNAGTPSLVIRTAITDRNGNFTLNEQPTSLSLWMHNTDRAVRFLLADFNGDRKEDLAYIRNVNETCTRITTLFSNGNGTFQSVPPTGCSGFDGWDYYDLDRGYRNRWMAGDANGDGRVDIMVVECVSDSDPNILCSSAKLAVGLSKGDGTYSVMTQPTDWTFEKQDDYGWLVGDANGDGKSDFVRIAQHLNADAVSSTRHVAFRVAMSKGDGSFEIKREFDTPRKQFLAISSTFDRWFNKGNDLTIPGDFNADGKTDIVFFTRYFPDEKSDEAFLNIKVAFSNGDGTFFVTEQMTKLTASFQNGMMPHFNNPNRWGAGDINGDGATDLLIAAPMVFYTDFLVTGTQIQLLRLISDKKGSFILQKNAPTNTTWVHRCYGSADHDPAMCDGDTMFDILLGDVNGDHRADVTYIGRYSPPDGSDDRVNFRVDLSANTGENPKDWRPADVNGDGRDDLIFLQYDNPGYSVVSLIRQADGSYSRNVDHGVAAPFGLDNPNHAGWIIMDVGSPVDGKPDGRSDLVYVDHTPGSWLQIWTLISYGDGTWKPAPSPFFQRITLSPGKEFPVGYSALMWMPIDVDGDGRVDLVHVRHEKNEVIVYVLFSKGNGTWTWNLQPIKNVIGILTSDEKNWHPADVNGDGRIDLVLITCTNSQSKVHTLISQGTNFSSVISQPLVPPTGEKLDFANTALWMPVSLNNDSQTDLLYLEYTSSGIARIKLHQLISNGNGTWQVPTSPVAWPTTNTSFSDTPNFRPIDLNRDGVTDLVHFSTFYETSGKQRTVAIALIYHPSLGWQAPWNNGIDFDFSDIYSWRITDKDGDGLPNFVYVSPQIYSLRWPVQNDQIDTETTPMGAVIKITYSPSSYWDANQPSRGCHLPTGAVLQTVRKVKVWDGRAAMPAEVSYSFSCAHWSYRERSFLGWDEVYDYHTAADNKPPSTVLKRYMISDECWAELVYTQTFDAMGNTYHKTIINYKPVGSQPPYRCLINYQDDIELNQHTVVGQNTITYFGYDEFGNINLLQDLGNPDIALDDRVIETYYRPEKNLYIVGLPAGVTIRAGSDSSGKPERITIYCYDGDVTLTCQQPPKQGLLTRRSELNNNGLAGIADTDFFYDPYGNVAGIQDANHHGEMIFYDSLYHIYPVGSCNALSQCDVQEWDYVMGRMKANIDINNQRTEFHYDVFGRLQKMDFPNGGSLKQTYLNWGNPASQRVHEVLNDGTTNGLWIDSYVDGLGRTYRSVQEGDTPTTVYEQETIFSDATSLVYLQSNWHKSGDTPLFEKYQYDIVSRLIRQTHPDNTYSSWLYNNSITNTWVESVDELGNWKATYSDAHDRISQVSEINAGKRADTFYTYNSVDEIKTIVDSDNNINTFEPDLRGRNTIIRDPDRGTSTYMYDLVGNLRTSEDARKLTIIFTYDALNRPKTKLYPDGRLVQWNYDEPGHGLSKGHLTSITDSAESLCPGYRSAELSYDVMGQLTVQKQCIEGLTYEMGFSYDQLARLKTVTYPDSEVVTYNYDSAGRLKNMPGYVNSLSYDAAGHVVGIEYANHTKTTMEYDSNRQWLSDITVLTGSNTVFQAGYEYYANGLINTTSSTTNKMNLTFTYDDMNRLKNQSGDLTQTFDYDLLGNMTYNSEMGTYAYRSRGCGIVLSNSCPHAVKSISAGPTFHEEFWYDANGNMTRSARDTSSGHKERSLEWNADDQPVKIQDYTGIWTNVRYDAFGQRIYRERAGEVTQYYGNYMDLTYPAGGGTLKSTQYYYAGSLLVARKESSGKFWYHQDHLGSTRSITDQSGVVVARYDYKPFGEIASPAGTVSSNVQFAGQRIDTENELIYMGARYYNPQSGRFISPDSIIPNLFNPSDLNSYSYVNNDPILFIDPTGHQGCNGMEGCYEVDNSNPPMKFDAVTIYGNWMNQLSSPPLISVEQADAPFLSDVSDWAQWPSDSHSENPWANEGFFESIRSGHQEPSFEKSLIPVIGSMQSANYHFLHENYGRGAFYSVLAITDVLIVRSLVMGAGKVIYRGGISLFSSQVAEGVSRAVLGNWRWFGNTAYSLRSAIWNNVRYGTASRNHWQGTARQLGMQLQHLWFLNSSKWAPQAIRNAGLNLLEVPAAFNNWMGAIGWRNDAFKLFVLTVLKGSAFGSYDLTQEIMGEQNK